MSQKIAPKLKNFKLSLSLGTQRVKDVSIFRIFKKFVARSDIKIRNYRNQLSCILISNRAQKIIVRTIVVYSTIITPTIGLAQSCRTSLAYLETRLPTYNDSDIQNAKSAILATDLNRSLQAARNQGFTPQSAAQAALQQAQQYEKGMPQAEQCVRVSAANPDAMLRSLQNGSADLRGAGGITGSCAKAYILYYYGYIANKEAAIDLACLAKK